ncbi:hypothetical protein ACFL5N_02795, partial [bacterium]
GVWTWGPIGIAIIVILFVSPLVAMFIQSGFNEWKEYLSDKRKNKISKNDFSELEGVKIDELIKKLRTKKIIGEKGQVLGNIDSIEKDFMGFNEKQVKFLKFILNKKYKPFSTYVFNFLFTFFISFLYFSGLFLIALLICGIISGGWILLAGISSIVLIISAIFLTIIQELKIRSIKSSIDLLKPSLKGQKEIVKKGIADLIKTQGGAVIATVIGESWPLIDVVYKLIKEASWIEMLGIIICISTFCLGIMIGLVAVFAGGPLTYILLVLGVIVIVTSLVIWIVKNWGKGDFKNIVKIVILFMVAMIFIGWLIFVAVSPISTTIIIPLLLIFGVLAMISMLLIWFKLIKTPWPLELSFQSLLKIFRKSPSSVFAIMVSVLQPSLRTTKYTFKTTLKEVLGKTSIITPIVLIFVEVGSIVAYIYDFLKKAGHSKVLLAMLIVSFISILVIIPIVIAVIITNPTLAVAVVTIAIAVAIALFVTALVPILKLGMLWSEKFEKEWRKFKKVQKNFKSFFKAYGEALKGTYREGWILIFYGFFLFLAAFSIPIVFGISGFISMPILIAVIAVAVAALFFVLLAPIFGPFLLYLVYLILLIPVLILWGLFIGLPKLILEWMRQLFNKIISKIKNLNVKKLAGQQTKLRGLFTNVFIPPYNLILLKPSTLEWVKYKKYDTLEEFKKAAKKNDWELKIYKTEKKIGIKKDGPEEAHVYTQKIRTGEIELVITEKFVKVLEIISPLISENKYKKLIQEIMRHEELERKEGLSHEQALLQGSKELAQFLDMLRALERLMEISQSNLQTRSNMKKLWTDIETVKISLNKGFDVKIEDDGIIKAFKNLHNILSSKNVKEIINEEYIIDLSKEKVTESLIKRGLIKKGIWQKKNAHVIFTGDIANYEKDKNELHIIEQMQKSAAAQGAVIELALGAKALKLFQEDNEQIKQLVKKGIASVVIRGVEGKIITGSGYISEEAMKLIAERIGKNIRQLTEEDIEDILRLFMM